MDILPIVKADPYLEPFAEAIYGRYEYAALIEKKLTGENQTLSDFATGYLYFGLHHQSDGWIFREWAPNASAIFLIGDFNNWQRHPDYQLKKLLKYTVPRFGIQFNLMFLKIQNSNRNLIPF